jgi:hypothetical protein
MVAYADESSPQRPWNLSTGRSARSGPISPKLKERDLVKPDFALQYFVIQVRLGKVIQAT